MRKTMLRAAAAALLLLLLPVLALADDFAVVRGGRLNLREYASTSSRILGKYSSGSWVRVAGQAVNGWWPVRTMDGKNGYMQGNYLTFATAGNSAVVRYANGGYVNLRQGPSLNDPVMLRVTSGSRVTILNDTFEWHTVSLTMNGVGYTGYMHESFLDKGTSSATVTTRNGGRVNVRSGPSGSYGSVGSLASGTKVTVLLKGNGWYQITGDGLTGFMSTSYLSGSGSTVGSNTGSTGNTGGTVSVQHATVNNPRSTQVLNLRESPSQSSRSIGQYRNGTQVKVVAYGSTWCEVYVGTRHGYMMTRYLSFNGSYTQPTVTAPPLVQYITPRPTATPLVQYITPVPQVQFITPVPQPTATPAPQTPGAPTAGTVITLAISAGGGNAINVFNDASLTSLKTTYTHGKQATMLQYGDSVCMILVDGGVAYVSTWNVNY